MKKQFATLMMAAVLMASLTIPAIAVNGTTTTDLNQTNTDDEFVDSPSVHQDVETDNEEIEVVTDNVVTGGFIRQKGESETRPLEKIDYPVIKITTLSMSQSANAKVDAANPDATDSQKSGVMTESGLSYGKNEGVNQTAERYYTADTTSEFVDGYDMSFFDKVVSVSQANLKDYSVIQIADISANSLAMSINQSVRLTFSAPGVKSNSRVVVARIRNGSMEFISSQAGNGSISFSVYPNELGTYVLMTRVG